MTNNDTSTLNGALQELGETMAANLTTMGVPSTYDEGLTTLAGKILNISPGPIPASISLTADKSILSYNDGESAILSATVLNNDNQGVMGETVEFFKGSVSIGTVTTNSSGVATITYASTGVGDVSFSAKCRSLVSETYSIEDLPFYADNMSKIKNTFIADTSVTGRTIYVSPFTFNSDVELEFKLKNIPNNWVIGFGSDGASFNSKAVWFKITNYNQDKASIMWLDTGGTARDASITSDYNTSTVFTIKSETIHKIYWYLDNVVKAYRDTYTGLPLGLRIDVFDNQDYDIEYIKVKAL